MKHQNNCPAIIDGFCICEPKKELIDALVLAWEEFELNWKYQIEDLPKP